MVCSLLLRGMLVGLVAGLCAFAFARVYGEPQVDRAIAFEEQVSAEEHHEPAAAHSHGTPEEEELVSRRTQAGVGLFTGVVVYGAALGGIFALVFSFAYGRLGTFGPRSTAALVALAGFLAVVAVPFTEYPANPPAIGNGETIGTRTELFFLMLALSIAAMVGAFVLAKRLWAAYGAWNAVIVSGAAFLVAVAIVKAAMPDINEVPEAFSADLLWRFRVASLGMHVILWTVLGLGFGMLAEPLLEPARRRGAARQAFAR